MFVILMTQLGMLTTKTTTGTSTSIKNEERCQIQIHYSE